METTRHVLPTHVNRFFVDLGNYLDIQLYYYGSVQRSDYVPGKSDIDIDVFCDHDESTIRRMMAFLHLPRSKFKRVVWIIDGHDVLGYKCRYENKQQHIAAEFSIYNNKYKHLVLSEHRFKMVLPWYVSLALMFIKFFFYTLPILPLPVFQSIKDYLLTQGLQLPPAKFLVIKN